MPTMKKINFIVSLVLLSCLDTMITAQERPKKVQNNPRLLSPRNTKTVTTSVSKRETPLRAITKKTVLTEEISPIKNVQLINDNDKEIELVDQNEIILDAPEIQNEPAQQDDTKDILEKLALINNIDTNNLKATQDSSHAQLFNNFVGLKNFIVQNFSKTKFQKLCDEFIDQIYPEDAVHEIDFGTPTAAPVSAQTTTPQTAPSSQPAAPGLEQTPVTTETANQPQPINDVPAATGVSFDFDSAPTENQSGPESSPESAGEEQTGPESNQDDSAESQPE